MPEQSLMEPALLHAWRVLASSAITDPETGRPAGIAHQDMALVLNWASLLRADFHARCPHWRLLTDAQQMDWVHAFLDGLFPPGK